MLATDVVRRIASTATPAISFADLRGASCDDSRPTEVFQNERMRLGLATYLRTARSDDIDAACGQLANRAEAIAHRRSCRCVFARARAPADRRLS